MNGAERLVVMDDTPEFAEFIRDVAENLDFEVYTPQTVAEFKDQVVSLDPVLIVLDLQMPEADGIELLRHLAQIGTRARVVLVSGSDRKVLQTARHLGERLGIEITAVLQKPVRLDDLTRTLQEGREGQAGLRLQELTAALEARQIALYYQPRIDLADAAVTRLVGVEALVRWQHPRYGLLLPDSFVPLAEASGLIFELTDYVVDATLRQMTSWRSSGVDLPVSVNLPAQFFDDRGLPDRLAALAEEHSVDPQKLTLEVTESSAMGDVERAMEVFTRLRLKGFPLAIDDFGTGYSSLVQLHRMPFSELKIDKLFVQDLATNLDSQSIVRAVVALGKGLDLKVCAEGIENPQALDLLRQLGCDYGQGFLFSEALPSHELLDRIRSTYGHEGRLTDAPLMFRVAARNCI